MIKLQLDSELKRLKEENSKLKQQIESSQNSSLIREYEHLQQQLSESEAALKKTRTIYQTKVVTDNPVLDKLQFFVII